MRLLVLSDLHVEHAPFVFNPISREFDVVVLAGDIHTPGRRAIAWAIKTFGDAIPVILVPGNHESYHAELISELAAMRDEAAGTNVHVLDQGSFVLGNTRILGCTLWTDFELPFTYGGHNFSMGNAVVAMSQAKRDLNDFDVIDIDVNGKRRTFGPKDALQRHRADRVWLLEQLNVDFDGQTVVVTHHSPSSKSVPSKYRGDSLSPCFSSELPDEFFGKAKIWIHGHHHSSSDYRHNGTLVICNPRGYRLGNSSFENPQFDPNLILDLDD